ncbi:uncharacterized protein LOC143287388 isoform X2 [Babylonia areolata]|uniref:uncharacterized protein LOC143287388 isoform X2 n=1 Tax=Babylonia areolata TaxID=304850 RepID=UPI003FD623EA
MRRRSQALCCLCLFTVVVVPAIITSVISIPLLIGGCLLLLLCHVVVGAIFCVLLAVVLWERWKMSGKGGHSVLVRAPVCLMLMAVGVWQRVWDSLHPLLAPVFRVYDTVDHDDLSVRSIAAQFVKSMMSAGLLLWEFEMAVVEVVLKPVRPWVDLFWRVYREVEHDFKHQAVKRGRERQRRQEKMKRDNEKEENNDNGD